MIESAYERILKEAARLFYGKGYSASSMEDIADAVGMKKGSLYYHISSKEQLLFEIMDRFSEKVQGLITPLLDSDEMSSADKIRQAIKGHLSTLDTDIFAVKVFLLEYRALGDDYRHRVLEGRATYETAFRRLVAEGIERGEFVDVDVAIATRSILGMCNWATQWYSPSGGQSTDEIASIFADIILGGLLKKE